MYRSYIVSFLSLTANQTVTLNNYLPDRVPFTASLNDDFREKLKCDTILCLYNCFNTYKIQLLNTKHILSFMAQKPGKLDVP